MPSRPLIAARLAAAGVSVGVVLVAVALVGAAPALGASNGEGPVEVTTLPELPEGAGRIIPPPGGGREPTHAGDRGGWQQGLVALLVLGGLGLVALFAVRDARRSGPSQQPGGPASPDGG